ncbi:MAG TPA: OmpH family outer membrane protein [Edaphobacter sp.]|nr:OmpH family outer membrane protein [Edaphobacter sp.]
MKRSGSGALILGFLCTLSASCAQNPALGPIAPSASSAPSIVTLNFNAVVLGTAEAQRSLGALQKKYSPREQQLQKSNDDIEALKKALNDSGSKLTEAESNQKLQELATKEKQLQREAEDFKNDSQTESQQVFQQVAQKVFSFLQEFSRQHGYVAVLERGTDAAPIVWYAASNVDITAQIIKSYDAKSGLGAPSLPNKPAAPRPSSGISPKKP